MSYINRCNEQIQDMHPPCRQCAWLSRGQSKSADQDFSSGEQVSYSYYFLKHKKSATSKDCALLCWDTRTRTRKGRTRICSVTITPYPNTLATVLLLIASAKVRRNSGITKYFRDFFLFYLKIFVFYYKFPIYLSLQAL